MTRQFCGNIGQVSNQVNSVVMGLAGADRIFSLLDEEPETDDGYVTLVNAKEENGELVECSERTDIWAWKHPHSADDSVTYTRLTGDVRLKDVDFGYNPDKIVLHDVSLYAEPGQKVAFVGATGAGKTTITNLINRFYDIADGKIRYDGININKIKKRICAVLLALFCRIRCSLPELSWKISAMASWMRQMKSVSGLQGLRVRMISSHVCPKATRR